MVNGLAFGLTREFSPLDSGKNFKLTFILRREDSILWDLPTSLIQTFQVVLLRVAVQFQPDMQTIALIKRTA